MSEHDFELYLSLLSRLLRLDAAQREQIADELRDHLEERLEQLTGLGLSREEAIRQAVEEFGDAAGLAASFSAIANRTRKRRLIMRCTLGSVGAAAAAILLAMAMWPQDARVQIPPNAVAQPPGKSPPAATKPPAAATPSAEDSQAIVDAKLDKKLNKIDFVDTPLHDVLTYLSDTTELDILVDKTWFQDNGLTLEAPITLQIKHAPVSARTALELALEQMGLSGTAGYTIRDGLVYITEKFQSHEIQVYNCRDLTAPKLYDASKPTVLDPTGEGLPSLSAVPGHGGMGRGDGFGGAGGYGSASAPPTSLVDVITATIHPDTWNVVGGSGSVAEFNGLLIVKHSQTVQREIKQLLDLMRVAAVAHHTAY